jgi:O-antigen/teichoic acid export membrane protein
MRRFSLPIWFSRLFTTAMSQGDRLLIGAFSNVVQVGLYHAAYRLAAFQSIAMNSFVPMFSTAIAEAHARDDRGTIVHYYRLVVRWSLLVTAPLGLICLVFGAKLLRLFGGEFEAALPVLFIVTLASFIDAGVGPAGQFLQMIGRERVASALVIFTALLTVGLNVWLIPRYGAVGAAIGTGTGIALLNLGRLLALRKYLGVFPYSGLTLRLSLTSACAGVVAWLAAPLGIVAQAMILLALYVVGMRLFCLHQDDREMLERLGKRFGVKRH